MADRERRHILKSVLGLLIVGASGVEAATPSSAATTQTPAEAWMEEVLLRRSINSPLALSRFVEPIYYLLAPFTWTPNKDNGPKFVAVTVPRGFVTDLASIPPLLFPLLRADGEYAQAAIVHDYLYWFQRTTREQADEIFKIAMRDLEVVPAQVNAIYEGVRTFGESAWNANARLRKEGEKRVLKKFPTAAATRWAIWKLERDVFE